MDGNPVAMEANEEGIYNNDGKLSARGQSPPAIASARTHRGAYPVATAFLFCWRATVRRRSERARVSVPFLWQPAGSTGCWLFLQAEAAGRAGQLVLE